MCGDANEPFRLKITFTDSNTTAIAIINTVMMIVSTIFLYLCKPEAGNSPLPRNQVAKLTQSDGITK
jgi:hypothetical protein